MAEKNADSYFPLVSIALTTSKSEKFLRQQLDSLINQTYRNIEIVISHDECGDNTVSILNEYTVRDQRIRWEPNKGQKGFIPNFENAVSMCKGEIIFPCDHDDVWHPERIQMHVEVYRNKSIKWIYNRSVLIDENNGELGLLEDTIPNYYSEAKLTLLNYAWGTCMGGAHISCRAELVHAAIPIPHTAPAHDTWLELFIYPAKVAFIDEILLEYRQHPGQQIGWNHVYSKEELKRREGQAISDNMHFLRYLPTDRRLALWKRFFFLIVYIAKIIRAKLWELKVLRRKSLIT